MTIHENLPRWIKASVAKHVSTFCDGMYLHVDGQDDHRSSHRRYIELNVIGPHVLPSHGINHIYVDVYLGCVAHTSTEDIYALERVKGIAVKALTKSEGICIYKFGDANETVVGRLRIRDDLQRPIDGVDFGVMSTNDIQVRRATVEGQYEMFLKE